MIFGAECGEGLFSDAEQALDGNGTAQQVTNLLPHIEEKNT